jgi:hypothetical protein
LAHVQQHETEVPGEYVRSADDVPRPEGEEHETCT